MPGTGNPRARIGVVDDDTSLCSLLANFLTASGYDVAEGATAEAARRLIDEDVDVLLLDLWLPDGSGVELTRETAARPGRPDIIIMTAEATLESAIEAVGAGASDYLVKPFDLKRLKALVDTLLERRRRRETRARAATALRSQRRLSRRRQAAQYAVGRVLVEAPTLEAAVQPLLREIAEALGFAVATLWVANHDAEALRLLDVWRAGGHDVDAFAKARRELTLPRGHGVAGRVWATAEPVWDADVAEALLDKLPQCLGFPVALGTEVLGVIELFGASLDAPDAELLEWVGSLGRQIAQFIDRKRGEARLRATNAALESLVQSSPAAIIAVDLERRVTGWNKTAERVFGWRAVEVLGRRVPNVPESESDDAIRTFERWKRREVTIDEEVVRLRKDGALLQMSRSGGPLLDADGRVVGALTTMFDITDRKRSEAALRESDERFRAVFEQAAVGIGISDLEGRWVRANQRLADMLGYSPEELLGLRFQEMTHPDDLAATLAARQDMIAGRRVLYSMEKRYLHKGGATVWVEATGSMVRDAAGAPAYSVVIVQDVSARVMALAARRESEERFRATFEQAAVGIAVVSSDGRFLRVNQRFCEMVGYTLDELTPLRFQDITHPDDVDMNLSRRRPMVENETPTYSIEKRYIRKDGSIIWVHVTASQARDASGTPRYSIGIVQDITERKQLEQELLHAQRMEGVGQLAGGIAHDFNNLLTVISGRSQLGVERLSPADPLRREFDLIHKTADRAAALTRQLLAFGRKQVLQPRVVAVNDLVKSSADLLKRLLGEHIELTFVPAAETGRVRVDPGQLGQVIVNLAVNARDAMPDGGRLTIEARNVELDAAYAARHVDVKPGPYVELAVSDTGSGMPPEVQARIFEPFFTTKGPGKGTGLGLSMVYGIVKQSGGHIRVESEPGAGTTFRVYLPRTDETPETEPARSSSALPGGTETVLLVEDDQEVRELAHEMLERLGYSVLDAPAPGDAILIAQNFVGIIDLLLTDVVMPRMSGRALAELIVAERPETRVLFMSGYTDDLIAQHGVLEPGTDLLQKPFAAQTLATTVREVLDRP